MNQNNRQGNYRPNSQNSGSYNQGQYNNRYQAGQYNVPPQNGRPMPRPGGQQPPRRRPPIRSYYNQNSSIGLSKWGILFASIIVLMITAGLFFTIIANRKENNNAKETDIPVIETAADTVSEDNQDSKPKGVYYAVSTKDTISLNGIINSDYGILIDVEANEIVAEKASDAMIYPASMTKIMTLIVAYEENKDNLYDTFQMTHEIINPLHQANASVAGFEAGHKVTIEDLLYGAILPSGADATDALAIYTSGSIEGFVDLMNKKATSLGLSHTHFKNPSGLHDPDHYSTPHEIALILEYAMSIDYCRTVLSTYKYTAKNTTELHPDGLPLVSTMFSRMRGDESGVATVLGGKTGYTNEGLNCLASFADVDGKEYILVTAHVADKYGPIYDCINVYSTIFGEKSKDMNFETVSGTEIPLP